jgi:hypothetical protein
MDRLALLLQQAITAEKVALNVTPPGELSNNAATETQYVQEASQIVQKNVQRNIKAGTEFNGPAARPRRGMADLA